jgi:hypothetical protein
MGWFKNAIDWIVNKILRPIVHAFTTIIENIQKAFRYYRIKWTLDFAEFLKDDTNFFLAFIGLIVGAFLLPHIAQLFGVSLTAFTTAVLANQLKDQLKSFSELRAMIILDTLHSIAKILFPEYQAAVSDFNKALSSLGDEMKVGAGYIHSYLAMSRGIIAGTCAIFGLPPEMLEYDWYISATKWSSTIRARLAKYVGNPESIFDDIITEVLIPLQANLVDTQQGQLNEVYEKLTRAEEVRQGLREVEISLANFISELPEEIEAQFNAHIGPALADMKKALDEFDNTIWSRVTGVIDQLQLMEDRFADINKTIEENKFLVEDLPGHYTLMSEIGKLVFDTWAAEAVIKGLDSQAVEQQEIILPVFEDWSASLAEALAAYKSFPSLSFEPAALDLPAPPSGEAGKSWFVGEY